MIFTHAFSKIKDRLVFLENEPQPGAEPRQPVPRLPERSNEAARRAMEDEDIARKAREKAQEEDNLKRFAMKERVALVQPVLAKLLDITKQPPTLRNAKEKIEPAITGKIATIVSRVLSTIARDMSQYSDPLYLDTVHDFTTPTYANIGNLTGDLAMALNAGLTPDELAPFAGSTLTFRGGNQMLVIRFGEEGAVEDITIQNAGIMSKEEQQARIDAQKNAPGKDRVAQRKKPIEVPPAPPRVSSASQ